MVHRFPGLAPFPHRIPREGRAQLTRLHINLAEETQLPVIIGLLDEAAAWLHDVKGSDQWPRPHPAPMERDARLNRGLRLGHTWICWDGTAAVATITAEGTGDPTLWTARELAEPRRTWHRLCRIQKPRRPRNRSRAAGLAGKRASRQYDAKWIRVDVWTTNKELHAYYKRQGFAFVRTCPDPAYQSGVILQKPTSNISPTTEAFDAY